MPYASSELLDGRLNAQVIFIEINLLSSLRKRFFSEIAYNLIHRSDQQSADQLNFGSRSYSHHAVKTVRRKEASLFHGTVTIGGGPAISGERNFAKDRMIVARFAQTCVKVQESGSVPAVWRLSRSRQTVGVRSWLAVNRGGAEERFGFLASKKGETHTKVRKKGEENFK